MQSPLPWESVYLGERGGQENFLVNPDDYYSPQAEVGKVSPESAADSLRTLSQVCMLFSSLPFHLFVCLLVPFVSFRFNFCLSCKEVF